LSAGRTVYLQLYEVGNTSVLGIWTIRSIANVGGSSAAGYYNYDVTSGAIVTNGTIGNGRV
jgi:hypothetical protein